MRKITNNFTDKSEKMFVTVAFVVYALIAGLLLLKHSMWRDETQLWMLAHSSNSISELMQNTEFEIRPMGWFLICWVLSRVTDNPEWLKLVNYIICLLFAATVLIFLPIGKLLRASLLMSFPILIGYVAVSEDYMLGALLLLLVTVSVVRNWSLELRLITLGLLANVHFLYFLIALPIILIHSPEVLSVFRARDGKYRQIKIFGSLTISVALGIASLITVWPNQDNRWRPKPDLDLVQNFYKSTNALIHSLAPFIDSSPLQASHRDLWLLLGLGAWGAVVLAVVLAWRVRTSLGIVGLLSLGLLVGNMTFGYGAFWWHFGVIFLFVELLLVVALCLGVGAPFNNSLRLRKSIGVLLCAIILPNIYASVTSPGRLFLTDRPYSNAKGAASAVEKLCLDDCVVVVAQEMTGVGISAYLDGRPVYYVDRQRFGTYTQWGDGQYFPNDWPALIVAMSKFKRSVLVTPPLEDAPTSLRRVDRLGDAIWADENFDIYVRKK